jgi:hypothetical protein
MTFFKTTLLAAAALTALGACATTGDSSPDQALVATPTKGALESAIDAAGGEAALTKVKELYWTGTATVNAGGKTSKMDVITVVRPEAQWARTSSWASGAEAKTSRTLQVEKGKAWDVNRQSWTPLPEAQATNESQQYGLYSLMLLTTLKASGAKADEQPAAADGTRTIKAQLASGQAADLKVDASGKLVGAEMKVRDPAGGADIAQTVKFSGEVESNGVKWPKRITIEQNGAPFYDLEIAKFEAAPAFTPRPMEQSMQYEAGTNNAGEEDAG